MNCCVTSGGNFLWVIVWRVLVIYWLLFRMEVIFMGCCVARGGNFYKGYCVAGVGILCVTVWQVVVICVLFCGMWW